MSFFIGKRATTLRFTCNACAWLLILVIATEARQISTIGSHSPGDRLEIEHAEFVLPSKDGEAIKGYATVWNGTKSGIFLESVESPMFSSLSIFKTDFVDGVARRLPKQVTELPPRSELIMKTGGIHLTAYQPADNLFAGKEIELLFNFTGGRRLTKTATILAPGTSLTDHHHGELQDRVKK